MSWPMFDRIPDSACDGEDKRSFKKQALVNFEGSRSMMKDFTFIISMISSIIVVLTISNIVAVTLRHNKKQRRFNRCKDVFYTIDMWL